MKHFVTFHSLVIGYVDHKYFVFCYLIIANGDRSRQMAKKLDLHYFVIYNPGTNHEVISYI